MREVTARTLATDAPATIAAGIPLRELEESEESESSAPAVRDVAADIGAVEPEIETDWGTIARFDERIDLLKLAFSYKVRCRGVANRG
jgi:hypothetical protein